jgi:hypothetical protein
MGNEFDAKIDELRLKDRESDCLVCFKAKGDGFD